MRFCPHCRRLNPGRPMFCHYCGRTWYVRLCPRGHESDPDAQFCGICGSADLTETAGPMPFWIWLIRFGILIICIIFFILFLISFELPEFQLTDQIIAQVISLAMLIFIIKTALSGMPGLLRRFFFTVIKIVKRLFVGAVVWCWERIKIIFR